ncbi:MAG: AAA family ATPase [Oscillospiraceae bacterium]|nr:AAA family ATPase [Oscillospiraceae bacterium]
MKLVIIFGAGSVGKMTVGQELMKITELRLFHNHMSIEPVLEIFGNFHSGGRAIRRIREVIFEEFAQSDNYGMIFTFMWSLDNQSDMEYLDSLVDIFRRDGADIYYVELVAPQEIRLKRNKTENRLKHKASKHNIEFSTNLILDEDANHRLVSHDGEILFENYIKIDNSELSPNTVAKMIKEEFSL